jgi:serine/threonine protein kinase
MPRPRPVSHNHRLPSRQPVMDDSEATRAVDTGFSRRPGATLAPGTKVGPYRIERFLAQGGNARVYRAVDDTLARPVALKILDEAAVSESRRRFLQEVQLIAGLVHPHIVGLYAAGEHDGHTFAAMELLPGSLADDVARRGRLPWDEALRAAHDACLGLEAASRKGVVHRDVKPSNLLRDASGAVKVGDFGLAKDLGSDLELTMEGVVLGTPLYVSPEQGCGRPTDLRSDLYSLGATLFHLIAGRPPYRAPTPFEIIVRHAVEPTPALGDEAPPRVSALVQRLMEKSPSGRPQTYEEAIALIASALDASDELVRPPVSRSSSGDALAVSQLAAARAAMKLGRTARARDMLDRLYRDRGAGWSDAGFDLASLLEGSGDFQAARVVLESISADAPEANARALALWTLGSLAEKESDAAIQRALDTYARVLEVSGTLFPKTLLDARINKLRAKARRGAS